MPAALPPSDPPNAKGICSYLWIAHRGDAGNGGERAEGDGDFENADADADAQGLTSTSTSSSSCSAFACLRHPFVRALADGSLPPSSFRFYVAQAFSRAYALVADAAAAAGDGAAAATLVELQESVDEELGLHRGFAASWGVVLDGASSSPLLPRASAATTAYTSFLLDTADKASSSSSHSLAGIARALAAMVPCCRLYGWLGVKIKQQEEKAEEEKRADTDTPEAKKNPFASWIETYSSCEYHAATVKLEGLLDRLAEGLSAEELASKQTMRSPPGAAASSPSARKSSSSSSSISASLRSPDMLQGLARGGLARRGSGAVAQALASPSPARPTKQIAGSAAARTTAAAPLARIGMQNDSPLPFFSIGASLATLFSRAMRLEHAFFTAAALGGSNNGGGVGSSSPGSGSKKPPRFLLPSLLVVDFDETLTAKDTTRLVIAAAASAASSRGDAGERARMEAAAAALVKRYVEEREALLERELPPRSSPPSSSSPSPSFSAAQTAAFLSELSAFDREANTRVFDSGILAGIARGELFELGKRRASESGGRGGDAPLLRPGAAAALAEACRSGVPTRVLSVSWSSELIQGALTGALQGAKEEAIEVSCDEAAWGLVSGGGRGEGEKRNLVVAVSANALEFDSSSSPPLSTGKVLRRVECADDKLEQFTALAASLLEGEGRERGPVVFVGDSPSDLGALLAADVGIVVAAADASSSSPAGPSKAELRGVAEALGIRVAPLAEAAPAFSPGGGGAPAREANSRTLFEAGSWSEVRRLLFGGDGASGGGAATAAAEASPFTAAAPPHPAVPRILSIAGSDSGGGAGIQADVKAASALGVFSATAVTAVTTQNSAGVSGVFRVPAATVAAQAEAVLSDIGADAIKTGMLADAETVEAVARVVERWRSSGGGNGEGGSEGEALHRRFPLVVDPVLVSTSGDPLASGGVASAMLSRLFPLATVVTPNLPEAAKLLGLDERRDLASLPAVAEAARRLSELGAAWVLVKGGHAVSGFADDADGGGGGGGGGGREAVDVLFERSTGAVTFLRAPRVETSVSHGTGCTLASAIACGLARGLSVPVAARSAKRYVGGALRASQGLRLGRGPQFPMNHGYATSACDWTGGEGLRAERTGEGAGEGGGGGADYRLYVVTDPRLVGAGAGEMRAAVAAAVRGGATVVQVRDKDAGVASLAASAAEAVRGAADGARGRPVAVLVNDRVDVAAGTAGAAGAHVGQGDLPAALARRALGHARLLGVSVRTPQQAVEAARRGADYVGAGAVFPTGTKEDAAVIGLHGLAEIVRASPVPVVAIGGVTAENAGDAIRAGASGVAVVSAVFGRKGDGREGSREEEVERAARAVRAAVDAAFAER